MTVDGGNVVIRNREILHRTAHCAALHAKLVKGQKWAALIHEVKVYVEQILSFRCGHDDVVCPDFFEHRCGHPTSPICATVRSPGASRAYTECAQQMARRYGKLPRIRLPCLDRHLYRGPAEGPAYATR